MKYLNASNKITLKLNFNPSNNKACTTPTGHGRWPPRAKPGPPPKKAMDH